MPEEKYMARERTKERKKEKNELGINGGYKRSAGVNDKEMRGKEMLKGREGEGKE